MDKGDVAEGVAPAEMDLPESSAFGQAHGRLGPSELDWIGRELREYHDAILREPAPERLLALIDRGLARRVFH